MVITYYGAQFFKIQFGDTVLAINPVSKDSGWKAPRFGADIVLVSANDPFFNGVENVSFGDKKPFVINGPGEYEIKNIFIKGIPSESSVGSLPAASATQAGEKKLNTVYVLQVDKMNICFLGALSSKTLPAESREAIDGVDILFAPIGGADRLSTTDAYSIAISLEPKIIIPMDYDEGSEAFKKFLKEGGTQKTESLDKLTVKQKDIEGKEGEIVVLAPQV